MVLSAKVNFENIPNVIAPVCVLHNICEAHYKPFNNAWHRTVKKADETLKRNFIFKAASIYNQSV